MIIISPSSTSDTIQTPVSLESENSFITNGGLLTGVFADNTITLSGFGCDDIYFKQ